MSIFVKKKIELQLNIIYFTTITKQVIQLILSILVGIDVCVRMVFVWEETGVPRGNPPVWLGDHMPISHADAGYRTRVAAVRGECVYSAPARHLQMYECANALISMIRVQHMKRLSLMLSLNTLLMQYISCMCP